MSDGQTDGQTFRAPSENSLPILHTPYSTLDITYTGYWIDWIDGKGIGRAAHSRLVLGYLVTERGEERARVDQESRIDVLCIAALHIFFFLLIIVDEKNFFLTKHP